MQNKVLLMSVIHLTQKPVGNEITMYFLLKAGLGRRENKNIRIINPSRVLCPYIREKTCLTVYHLLTLRS